MAKKLKASAPLGALVAVDDEVYNQLKDGTAALFLVMVQLPTSRKKMNGEKK